MAAHQRPLSPFMIGPYYRPQLTSVLSITHRITGVLLSLAAFAMVAWLIALGSSSEAYGEFMALATGTPGKLLLLVWAACISFHLFNGIRHLAWDAGWGLDLPRTYATGWTVVLISVVLTAAFAAALWLGGAA